MATRPARLFEESEARRSRIAEEAAFEQADRIYVCSEQDQSADRRPEPGESLRAAERGSLPGFAPDHKNSRTVPVSIHWNAGLLSQ